MTSGEGYLLRAFENNVPDARAFLEYERHQIDEVFKYLSETGHDIAARVEDDTSGKLIAIHTYIDQVLKDRNKDATKLGIVDEDVGKLEHLVASMKIDMQKMNRGLKDNAAMTRRALKHVDPNHNHKIISNHTFHIFSARYEVSYEYYLKVLLIFGIKHYDNGPFDRLTLEDRIGGSSKAVENHNTKDYVMKTETIPRRTAYVAEVYSISGMSMAQFNALTPGTKITDLAVQVPGAVTGYEGEAMPVIGELLMGDPAYSPDARIATIDPLTDYANKDLSNIGTLLGGVAKLSGFLFPEAKFLGVGIGTIGSGFLAAGPALDKMNAYVNQVSTKSAPFMGNVAYEDWSSDTDSSTLKYLARRRDFKGAQVGVEVGAYTSDTLFTGPINTSKSALGHFMDEDALGSRIFAGIAKTTGASDHVACKSITKTQYAEIPFPQSRMASQLPIADELGDLGLYNGKPQYLLDIDFGPDMVQPNGFTLSGYNALTLNGIIVGYEEADVWNVRADMLQF
jgi:hypothetical protein